MELRSVEAPVDECGEVGMTHLENTYNIQRASGEKGGERVGSGSTTEHVTVGGNSGYSRNNVQARADERLPFVQQRSRSPSGGLGLNVGELRSVQTGIDKRRGGGRSNAMLRECLLPMKLLEEQRVRTVMFVNVLFSVRTMVSCPL